MSDDLPTAKTEEPIDDPFALEHLHLGADFADALQVKKVLVTLAVRKPGKQEWVRVRKGDEWQSEILMVVDEEDGDGYYVHPKLRGELSDEGQVTKLFVAMNRQAGLFLWPCRIQAPNDKPNLWHVTRLDAAHRAADQWIQVRADQANGHYTVTVSPKTIPEPEWPDYSLEHLIRLAFKGKLIADTTHPIIRKIRGEI